MHSTSDYQSLATNKWIAQNQYNYPVWIYTGSLIFRRLLTVMQHSMMTGKSMGQHYDFPHRYQLTLNRDQTLCWKLWLCGAYSGLPQLLAHRAMELHGLVHSCSHANSTTPLLQAGGFMLPFVVVGGCIVVLMLILVVLGNSTGTADVMRHRLMYQLPSQWSTLCPVDCTSKTLSWRLLLRLLTNIIIVIVGKSLPVQIILWTHIFYFVLN